MRKHFLTATWKHLVFANYEMDPALLQPYVPAGTELDYFEGKCYVSLVGFMFLDTKVRGIRVPLHTNFEEFNLRFYVRYKDGQEWKRGVVFVKEIVPRLMISLVARLLYGEHYHYMKMRHDIHEQEDEIQVKYEFKYRNRWNRLQVWADRTPQLIDPHGASAFITEHYWGYTQMKNKSTSEYEVKHPVWNIHPVHQYDIDINTLALYGPAMHRFLKADPVSVFVADGSPVSVMERREL